MSPISPVIAADATAAFAALTVADAPNGSAVMLVPKVERAAKMERGLLRSSSRSRVSKSRGRVAGLSYWTAFKPTSAAVTWAAACEAATVAAPAAPILAMPWLIG